MWMNSYVPNQTTEQKKLKWDQLQDAAISHNIKSSNTWMENG